MTCYKIVGEIKGRKHFHIRSDVDGWLTHFDGNSRGCCNPFICHVAQGWAKEWSLGTGCVSPAS